MELSEYFFKHTNLDGVKKEAMGIHPTANVEHQFDLAIFFSHIGHSKKNR